jgi:hypothetical protein
LVFPSGKFASFVDSKVGEASVGAGAGLLKFGVPALAGPGRLKAELQTGVGAGAGLSKL